MNKDIKKQIMDYLIKKLILFSIMMIMLVIIFLTVLGAPIIFLLAIFHCNVEFLVKVELYLWCSSLISVILSFLGGIYIDTKGDKINSQINEKTLTAYLELLCEFKGNIVSFYDLIDLFYKYIKISYNSEIQGLNHRIITTGLLYFVEDNANTSAMLPNKFTYTKEFQIICKEILSLLDRSNINLVLLIEKWVEIKHFYEDNKYSSNEKTITFKKNYPEVILIGINIIDTTKEIYKILLMLSQYSGSNFISNSTLMPFITLVIAITKLVFTVIQYTKNSISYNYKEDIHNES